MSNTIRLVDEVPEQRKTDEASVSVAPISEVQSTSANTTKNVVEGTGREATIYTRRFSPSEEALREVTWRILVDRFFQRYVSTKDVVIDIGAGDGHFIRNIRAGKKIAVDLSSHVQELTRFGVEVFQVPATEFTAAVKTPAQVIFMSNFLEHLPDKRVLLNVLEECRRGLAPGGMLLILQPNIRYVGAAYWDYVDHHIALTEHSLSEALEVSGFRIQEIIPRFLPYTAKSSVGRLAGMLQGERAIEWYLKLPFLWRLLGQQTFVAARRAE